MIVKQKRYQISKAYLFNAAGALMIFFTAGLAIRSSLFPEPVAECTVRLVNPMRYSLQRQDGELLSASELQARLAGRDWGVLENARVVKLKDGPAPLALKVSLPATGGRPGDAAQPTSGIGFPWLNAKLQQATAVCLTYSVYLPEDFKFGPGGSLPGLIGGVMRDREKEKPADGFSTRLRWHESGAFEVYARNANAPGGHGYGIDTTWTKLPLGRWVRISQELALNTPGESDGILRIWVDGELKLEQTDVPFRNNAASGIHGVGVDVHYADANLGWMLAPKSTSLWITPFELRWE